jgi:hypothetical protein
LPPCKSPDASPAMMYNFNEWLFFIYMIKLT